MSMVAITNVTAIDAEGLRTPEATVVVQNDRITKIVPGGCPIPDDGCNVIDASGCSVMPGMFNCHYHSSYHAIGSTGLPIGMEGPPALLALRAVRNLQLALDSGFTSLISAGAPHAIDAALKNALQEGAISGPRIMAGSRDVSSTGHSQDRAFPWYWEAGRHPGILRCDGPEEFRRGVREEIKRGAEIIKIFATSGHAVRGDQDLMEVSRDELAAAIDAAHERGAKVRAHIANKKAICMAVELGIDAVDHGDGLDSECIQLMAEHGAVLIPSCFFPFRVSRFRNGAAADRMVQDMKAMLGILSTADAAGVTIALGDDYGTLALEHGEYGQELSFYVEHAGITPQTAIRWATRNGAIMMGVQKDLGDLKPGMLADLIIVRGDPVVDITVLANPANILTVMKDGRLERNRLPLRLVGPAQ